MKTIHKILIESLAVVLLLSAFGYSSGQVFEDWDVDKDDRISRSEFNNGFGNSMESYITRNDDEDNKRIHDVTYSRWDANNDNRISAEEWNTGVEFNRDYHFDEEFSVYDADRNNYLSFDEYENAISNSSLNDEWDTDDSDLVNDTEIATGVFDNWDRNSDSYLNRDEFSRFEKYYMTGN